METYNLAAILQYVSPVSAVGDGERKLPAMMHSVT
jgi:hypothetical protein